MDEIGAILNEIVRAEGAAEREDLVDGGLLDSFAIVSMIAAISERCGVRIPPLEIVPENFNSAKAIRALVLRLAEE